MVLDEYERQLRHPVPELGLFEVISILRRIGTVMISLGAGPETLGMRPETLEAMRKDQIPLMRRSPRVRKPSIEECVFLFQCANHVYELLAIGYKLRAFISRSEATKSL